MATCISENNAEPVTFLQSCPVCGRRLHIAVEYDGAEVVCFHCHAMFRARQTSNNNGVPQVGRSSPRSTVRVATSDPIVAAALG
ncbi:MAG: hypothetical protein ACRC46_05115 [Thermoguttaceae bacterium]